MKNKITLLVSFMLCLGIFSTSLFAQDWVLKKDKSGIKVYVKEQVGSNIKELKFTTTIEASMSTIAAVLTHIEGFDDWSYGVNSSRVIKRVSDSEIYYHCNVDFPWPFDDRDIILHSTVWQDKKTMALHSKSTSSHTLEKEKDDFVRIKKCEIYWTFTPISNGKVKVDYRLNSDPAGNIPAWMVNLAADQGPLKTMVMFKDMLKKEKYKNSKLAFVENVGH